MPLLGASQVSCWVRVISVSGRAAILLQAGQASPMSSAVTSSLTLMPAKPYTRPLTLDIEEEFGTDNPPTIETPVPTAVEFPRKTVPAEPGPPRGPVLDALDRFAF